MKTAKQYTFLKTGNAAAVVEVFAASQEEAWEQALDGGSLATAVTFDPMTVDYEFVGENQAVDCE